MKKINTLAILIVFAFATHAQPVLTTANSNPVPGDIFYHHDCDGTGITSGATGAGVTWDYSGLVADSMDTIFVINCTSTPFCDSFPGSTIVEFEDHDSNSYYLGPVAGNLEYLGEYFPAYLGGAGFLYYPIPLKFYPFPLSYGDTWQDTSFFTYDIPSHFDHILTIEKNVADGYGTLKTPAGIYSNVLRIHSTSYVFDTSLLTMPPVWQYDTIEQYSWYQAGSHYRLLYMQTDSTLVFSATPIVEYNTMMSPEAVPTTQNNSLNFVVFPNPSSDFIHIRNEAGYFQSVAVSLVDITGREVWEGGERLIQNHDEVTIPVSLFAPGIYLLKLQTSSSAVIKKVSIGKD